MSLGTPHYMSPEQAMGEREITARSDVYALGCVLYEMLTGDPPFTGSTAQAIVARVVTESPRPMLPQRETIPAHVEAAVMTSLQKLPADRFKTAAEFAEALADSRYASSSTVAMPAVTAPRSRVAALTPWVVAGMALVAGLVIGARVLARPTPVRPLRLSIPVPSELPPIAIRLSPDGGTLAYVSGQGDRFSIYTRRLDDLRPRRLEGTDDGFTISFSPDGQSIAYLGTNNSPRKVPIGGGTSVAIPVEGGAGLTAIEFDGPDRFVVSTQGALATLAPNGALTRFAVPDSATSQTAFALDQVLPDHWVLARYWRAPPNGPVVAIDPATGRRVTVVDANVAWAGYANGMLVWALPDGTLFAAPWDLKKKGPVGTRDPAGSHRALHSRIPAADHRRPRRARLRPDPVARAGAGGPVRPVHRRARDRPARTTIRGCRRTGGASRWTSPSRSATSGCSTSPTRRSRASGSTRPPTTPSGCRTGADCSSPSSETGRSASSVASSTRAGGRTPSSSGRSRFPSTAVTADQRTGIGVVIEGSAFDIVAVNLEGRGAIRHPAWPAGTPRGGRRSRRTTGGSPISPTNRDAWRCTSAPGRPRLQGAGVAERGHRADLVP